MGAYCQVIVIDAGWPVPAAFVPVNVNVLVPAFLLLLWLQDITGEPTQVPPLHVHDVG